MKKHFIILMLLLSLYSHSQNRISGTITDTGRLPLAGATVYLPELNKGTYSDINGFYELIDLPDGRIKVLFSYMGYTTQIQPVLLEGNPLVLNVVLETTTLRTEEIVITGGYSSTQHENAVKIESLDLLSRENPASPNFTERLTRIPGVDMISKGTGVSKPVIRGLSMNDILILNNGVRFENYQYSSHHPMGIDEFGYEDVEIIKGPASLLYGSDAIGGVINFIREKPAPVGSITGDYHLQMFTNSLGMVNNFGIKGSTKKTFGGIRIGHKTHADYLEGGGRFVPNSRFNEYSIKLNGGYTGKTGTFRLFYDYIGETPGLAEDEAVKTVQTRGRNNEEFYLQSGTHLVSSQNLLYFRRYKLNVNAAFQNTELSHIETDRIHEIQMSLATVTYEAKLYFPSAEGSEYIAGIQGLNQKNSNLNDREVILLPDAGMFNYSVYGLVQQSFFKKLTLQAGLRYDFKGLETRDAGEPGTLDFRKSLNKRYSSISGSIGGTYHFSDHLLIRANIASAFRTPNIAELTSNGPHESRFEIGDQDLVPEKSLEADVSTHYHLDNLTLDLAIFTNRINHFIFLTPTMDTTGEGLRIYRYTQEDSRLFGGEAGIHYHPEGWKWLHLEAAFSAVTGKKSDKEYLPLIPAHKINLEARVEKEKIWVLEDAFFALNLKKVFDQNRPAPDETATDGYTLIDISAGGNISTGKQKLFIGLGATNLFDIKYTDHLSTLKEVGYHNPGRNLSLTLSWPFRFF